MNRGHECSGYKSAIINNRPKYSNYHIAHTLNNRTYLCGCCKRVLINNKPKYPLNGKNTKFSSFIVRSKFNLKLL